MTIRVEPHPLARPAALRARFPRPLGELSSPESVRALLRADAAAPLVRDEELRRAVRDLLRHGGYRPTGRGKPSSEYLVRAAGEEPGLRSINPAVDLGNALSLHSGLPVSVVDLGRARPPFTIALAPAAARFVFNPAGQEIDLGGLLCLFDADGPCANAVKDAQRTKTDAGTRETLSILWGVAGWEERVAASVRWYRTLLQEQAAETEELVMDAG